jgi:hypothetical protein
MLGDSPSKKGDFHLHKKKKIYFYCWHMFYFKGDELSSVFLTYEFSPSPSKERYCSLTAPDMRRIRESIPKKFYSHLL